MSQDNGAFRPHNPAPLAKEEAVRLDKPGLWTIRVTPEIAYEWLTKNYKQNRRIRPAHVNYLAEEIKAGRWQENHPEAVLFDEMGEMIEGQHRMSAVVEAEIPVRMRVETGVKRSLYPYLDSGLVRTLDDRVKFHDNAQKNKVIVMLLNFFFSRTLVDGPETVTRKGRRGRRLSPEMAYEIYKKHKKACHWAADNHRLIRGVGRMSVLGACSEFYEMNPEKADAFAKTLYSQNGEGPVIQARLLRDTILRKFQVGKVVIGGDDTTLYHMAVAAMKAYAENRTPTIIKQASWE